MKYFQPFVLEMIINHSNGSFEVETIQENTDNSNKVTEGYLSQDNLEGMIDVWGESLLMQAMIEAYY